jgi:xanthine dehydrogenase YagT iron-sulfur-binding subunit
VSEPAGTIAIPAAVEARERVQLDVNGRPRQLLLEARTTLLEALRMELGLTGTKLGCDHGNCGACTVLVNGRAQYACLRLAVDCDDCAVTTVEGLAGGGEMHPVQQAFIDEDALQCGFCTPGQIMSAISLLGATSQPDDTRIVRGMSGNLCRCGAYANIRAAVKRAAGAS